MRCSRDTAQPCLCPDTSACARLAFSGALSFPFLFVEATTTSSGKACMVHSEEDRLGRYYPHQRPQQPAGWGSGDDAFARDNDYAMGGEFAGEGASAGGGIIPLQCQAAGCFRFAKVRGYCLAHFKGITAFRQRRRWFREGGSSSSAPVESKEEELDDDEEEEAAAALSPRLRNPHRGRGRAASWPRDDVDETGEWQREGGQEARVRGASSTGLRGNFSDVPGDRTIRETTETGSGENSGRSSAPERRKNSCRIPGCQSLIRSRGLCKRHGGGSRCQFESCPSSARQGGFCIRHGGGLCKVRGCKSGSRRNGMCTHHNTKLRGGAAAAEAYEAEDDSSASSSSS